MPYTIRKRKCKQSDGDSGRFVLSYTDQKGKKHRACHTSKKKARGQIAAIEAESLVREYITNVLQESLKETTEELATKKDDKDHDGDADFADVMIARMTAGGMSKKKAIKKSKKHDQ